MASEHHFCFHGYPFNYNFQRSIEKGIARSSTQIFQWIDSLLSKVAWTNVFPYQRYMRNRWAHSHTSSMPQSWFILYIQARTRIFVGLEQLIQLFYNELIMPLWIHILHWQTHEPFKGNSWNSIVKLCACCKTTYSTTCSLYNTSFCQILIKLETQ